MAVCFVTKSFTLILRLIGEFLLEVIITRLVLPEHITNISAAPPVPLTNGFTVNQHQLYTDYRSRPYYAWRNLASRCMEEGTTNASKSLFYIKVIIQTLAI